MDSATCVRIGPLEQIPLGQGRCFLAGEEEIAVFRQRDGRLFAAQNRCPHRQGPLAEGLLGGGKVLCPLHAHRFNLETGQGGEPKECIRIYPVRQIDGEVFVTLGTP